MANTEYPFKTSADEFTRLEIQADLFRDDAREMLGRIGDGSGLRVLDLCCGIGGITDVLSEWVGAKGHVLGADLDTVKLDHARTWAGENGLTNVEFVEANAFDSGLPSRDFDLAHTRFALSVIQNGLGILDHMLTLVRPGGVIFVEEANTFTMECAPTNKDWDQALKLVKDTFSEIGADTRIGPALRGVFLEKGLTNIEVKPCLHALTARDPMALHLPMTLAAMRDAIIPLRLIGGKELDELIARVTAHLMRPETMTISYSMVQVVGRMTGRSISKI